MTLRDFLPWVTTSGAGLLAYWLIENIVFFASQSSLAKRLWAYALSGGFAVIAWLFMIAMLYVEAPGDWRAWVEGVFAVATGAFALSQIVHGLQVLGKK